MARRTPIATSFGAFALVCATLAACSDDEAGLGRGYGSGGDQGGDAADAGTGPAGNLPINPGTSPLRRLTNEEYDNTVADLLGDTTSQGKAFPGATTSTLGYDTYATGLGVSETHAEAFLTAAETLAQNAIKDMPKLLQCDVASKGEAACAQSFVTSFGERAFRRPLTAAEVARFQQLQTTMRASKSYADSIRVLVEAFLLSPAFLYRVELGVPGKAGDFVKLSSWEMASRLSYLFTGSMPDDELFRAARADELQAPEAIEKQARRLVASPRAKATFARFSDQWLELRAIESMQKTAASFAGWSDSLRPLLKEEAARVVDSVVWGADGDARKLFNANYTFVNGPLASFYGISGVSGDAFVKVPLDPGQRLGVLTLPGVLASHGKPNETLPARRGKFVRTKIFCLPVGDPPPNAAAMAPQRAPGMTVRQFFTLIEQQPACGSCHKSLDGLGFGLENYDSVGRWRTTDQGQPVDSSGVLTGTDVDGAFTGGVELANKVASSNAVTACLAKQMFRFATGRPETGDDARSLTQLAADFSAAKYDVRELFVSLTRTDAFTLKVSQGVSQ